MYNIPTGFGPIPDPIGLGAAFVSDLSFIGAAWLAAAAVLYLAVLPLAVRRTEPDSTRIEPSADELREAA